MSTFGLRVDAADVDWQIRMLKLFPEIVNKHFEPVMRTATASLSGEIQPNIPTRTGKARDTFKSSVTGNGLNMKGRVGWWYSSDPWYMNVVEYGAKEHKEVRHVSGKAWTHPGFSPRYFMRTAETKVRARNDALFAVALDRVVKDLTKK